MNILHESGVLSHHRESEAVDYHRYEYRGTTAQGGWGRGRCPLAVKPLVNSFLCGECITQMKSV